jgi:hypoxanthine phosphoribosyltransferase
MVGRDVTEQRSAAAVRVRWGRPQILARVQELAEEVAAALPSGELVLLGVLPGGLPFLADLCRALRRPHLVDFAAVRAEEGRRALAMDLQVDVAGRHVVVVDDLVESGGTVAFLCGLLRAEGAASVRVCAFLERSGQHVGGLVVDHVGFAVGEEALVGYGIAPDGVLRAAPAIAEVLDAAALLADPRATRRAMAVIEGAAGRTYTRPPAQSATEEHP